MTARNHVPPAFAVASLAQVALLACVLGFPPSLLAEPAGFPGVPASPSAVSPESTHPIEGVAIKPAMPRSPGALIALPYFPPDSDGSPGRLNEHSDELNIDDEAKIPLMDETVVESTFEDSVEDPFEDPFATESEPVRDPWEPLNATTFKINYNIDRYALKPVARVYSFVVPPDVQGSLANAFDNLGFVSRFLNNIFQGKFSRAGTEMQRFLLNSTLGVGGLFDVAKYMFEIEAPPVEDAGQTLATYGVGSGPYMVLPLLPPMTVRDAVGIAGDIFMNPVNYFIPFVPNLGLNAGGRVNDRAINLETFEGLEESTIDLYGAVRSGYLDRRAKDIQE